MPKIKDLRLLYCKQNISISRVKTLSRCSCTSKFITEKKSRQLIKKIGSLTSSHEAKQLTRHIYVAGRVKALNEKIYYNVDTVSYTHLDVYKRQMDDYAKEKGYANDITCLLYTSRCV